MKALEILRKCVNTKSN